MTAIGIDGPEVGAMGGPTSPPNETSTTSRPPPAATSNGSRRGSTRASFNPKRGWSARFEALRAEMAFKAEMLDTMVQQNRALFFSMAALMMALAALAFGATRIG